MEGVANEKKIPSPEDLQPSWLNPMSSYPKGSSTASSRKPLLAPQ